MAPENVFFSGRPAVTCRNKVSTGNFDNNQLVVKMKAMVYNHVRNHKDLKWSKKNEVALCWTPILAQKDPKEFHAMASATFPWLSSFGMTWTRKELGPLGNPMSWPPVISRAYHNSTFFGIPWGWCLTPSGAHAYRSCHSPRTLAEGTCVGYAGITGHGKAWPVFRHSNTCRDQIHPIHPSNPIKIRMFWRVSIFFRRKNMGKLWAHWK